MIKENSDSRNIGAFGKVARQLILILPLLVASLACGLFSGASTATPYPTVTATIFVALTPTDQELPTLTPEPLTTLSASGGGDCTPRADWTATYTIVAGDTLSGLAQQTGSTADVIAAGNCLANANSIVAGQVLRLPAAVQLPQSAGRRIQFPLGAISVPLQGQVAAGGLDRWVLRAQAGQTMTVQLAFTTGAGVLIVWGADGTVLQSDHAGASSFSGALPKTQDYFIDVRGNPDGAGSYALTVTIPPLPF